MLSNERHTRYRGSDITVRWTVVESTPVGRLFTASFSIAPTDSNPLAGQSFPERKFHTSEYAARFALDEARRLIDEAHRARESLR